MAAQAELESHPSLFVVQASAPKAGGMERGGFLMEKEGEVDWEWGWRWLQLYVGISPFPLSLPP